MLDVYDDEIRRKMLYENAHVDAGFRELHGDNFVYQGNRLRCVLPGTKMLEGAHVDISLTTPDEPVGVAVIVSLCAGRVFTYFKDTSSPAASRALAANVRARGKPLSSDVHYVVIPPPAEPGHPCAPYEDALQARVRSVIVPPGSFLLFAKPLMHAIAGNNTRKVQLSYFISPQANDALVKGKTLDTRSSFARRVLSPTFPDNMSLAAAVAVAPLIGVSPPVHPSGKPTTTVNGAAIGCWQHRVAEGQRLHANLTNDPDAPPRNYVLPFQADCTVSWATLDPVALAELSLLPPLAFAQPMWAFNPLALSRTVQQRMRFRPFG
jgi:hypothetical protein